jgi:glycosyltransferase involved in cell wall biosynthesis
MYKKINKSIKLYEIYHSDFIWPDAMSTIDIRDGIDTVFKTSNLVGKNITVKNQIICPPPLDFSRFNFSRKTGKIRNLGFIGRLSPEKNPLLAIDIANKLKMPLIMAGDGPLKSEIVLRLKNDFNHVTFLGWQNPLDFYKKIDCLILTSEVEGLPNVILEALASGLPIISTDVGGIPDVLSNTNSFLFNKNNLNIDNLKNFIENNSNYNFNNVLKAKEYDKETICKKFFDEIKKDFIKPIEIMIKNNDTIINGMLL